MNDFIGPGSWCRGVGFVSQSKTPKLKINDHKDADFPVQPSKRGQQSSFQVSGF